MQTQTIQINKLPEGWEVKRLEEIIETIDSGSRPKGGVRQIRDGIPSIGAEYLNDSGGFNFEKIRFVPEDFYNSMTRGKIQMYDILLVKDGATTGKVSFVDENFPFKKAAINEHVFLLRGKKETILQKYLFYFIFSEEGQKQIRINFQGTTQGGINKQFINNFFLPIPPRPTQQKIVSRLDTFFSHYNKLKEEKQKAKENYEKILQSAIASQIPQELPEGWRKTKIKEVVLKTETKDPKKEQNKKFIYVDISSINKDNFKIENPKQLTGKIAPSRARKIIKENDVIFSTNRPNLKTISIIPERYNNQICSTGFCVLRSSNKILPKFLFYLMISDNVLDQINPKMRGIQYPAVSDSDVLNTIINLPPIEEQEKIIKKLDTVYQGKNNIEQEQNIIDLQLSQLPKSVLSKAFKGELV